MDKIDLNHERIVGVKITLNKELNNIAKNLGITKAALLKKKLRLIIDEYPEELKQTPPVVELKECRITGISPKTKLELKNIAGNLGIDKASFLKLQLFEIAKSFPKEMRESHDSND